jgi:hypothetical protein
MARFTAKMARLLEGIRTADAAGANAVDFEEFVSVFGEDSIINGIPR